MARRDPLLQAYEGLKELSSQARQHQDREAWLNTAFYLNQQYVRWEPSDQSLRVVPRRRDEPEDQPRPVVNQIMHYVNSNLSFALQSKPEADVRAANDDPLALSDAAVAKAWIDYLMDDSVGNWRETLRRTVLWAMIANEGYIKWIMDKELQRPIFMFVPSTELYSDPYANEFRKCRYIIHSQFMDPEMVYELYGEEIGPKELEAPDKIKTQLLRDMGQTPVQSGVTVNELWHLPSRRHPEGIYAVWAGQRKLYGPAPFPYDHGQLPFTQIGVIPRPNSKHYASPVTFMRAPQTEINRYHAQRLMLNEVWMPHWWIPDTVDLREDPNDNPRQILRGGSSTGEAPSMVGPQGNMPDNREGDWLDQSIMNVAGIHEVSQGQVPGRVEAAQAIELLREADASRLAVLLETIAASMSQGFWQTLMLTKQYVPGRIIVNAYSPEGVAEVKRFKGNDLDPSMKVKITMGTGLARTRAARMDQLITLWQQQIIRDPEEFARLAELATPTTLSTRAADVRLARNENYVLSEGNAITANSWDDHTIHIREHNLYRKTSEFEALTDGVKLRFEHHVQEHKDLEIQMLAEELQKQQMVVQLTGQQPGAPGQTGGGPSPNAAPAGGQGQGGSTNPSQGMVE